jgi:hypothetical protein
MAKKVDDPLCHAGAGEISSLARTARRCSAGGRSATRFEPSGMTKNPEVASRPIVDYIFRWMATKFLSPEAQSRRGEHARGNPKRPCDARPSAPNRLPAKARL